MPRGGWDGGWPRYPASAPLPVEGGVVTSKQRGAMAESWWSQRFVEVLESYGLGGRMQRGRRYARTGQVVELDVQPSVISARVQGSRPTLYEVSVTFPEPRVGQWAEIDAAMAAKVGFVARLLAGELPADLEEVFAAAGVALFPATWRDLRAMCNCPDWGDPCKHVAAVLYVFADQLDRDPWLLLAWRGRRREDVLDRVGAGSRAGASAADEVAPWWPFAAGVLPAAPPARGDTDTELVPERADEVLDVLEPLDVVVEGTYVADLLRPAYEALVAGGVDVTPPDPEFRSGAEAGA
jgi:uncharacterized Zn finger protein